MSACAAPAPILVAEPVAPVVQARPMQIPQGAACLPRADMLQRLAEKYEEAPVAAGLTSTNNIMVEILTTGDGGSWSLIITNIHGKSCMIANGYGWRSLDPPGPHLGPGA